MRWRTEHTTIVALLVALLLPVFCVWAALHAAGDLTGARTWVGNSQRVISNVQNTQLQLSVAGSEQRAFLLRPIASHRAAFDQARKAVLANLATLATLVKGDPPQAAAVKAFAGAVQTRLAIMQQVLDLRAGGHSDAALSLADSQTAVDAGASIRQAAAAVQGGEQSELGARRTAALAFQRRWTRLFWAACIASLAMIVGCFVVLVLEVRRRRRAQEALGDKSAELTRSSDRYNHLIANIPSAVWTIRQTGAIEFVSSRVADLTGYTEAEMRQNGPAFWLEKVHPDDRQAVVDQFERLFAASAPLNVEFRLLHANGSWVWLQAQSNHVTGAPGDRVADGITTDISARKRYEAAEMRRRDIEVRNREMEAANRMKSEFLASVSHELRTPLSAILGFSDLMLQKVGGELNTEHTGFAEHIHQAGQHLLDLVTDILDLARIEAGRLPFSPESVPLKAAAQEALQTLQPHAQQKHLTLRETISDTLLVSADPLRLRQILINLLGNAIKFTPESGCVELSATGSGAEVVLCVSDTGIGIEPRFQKEIFERFRQLGAAGASKEGAGLGLAITQQLVQLHHGRIWVESEPGRGSRFFFTLPLAAAAAETAGAGQRRYA